jgi:pyruvate,water dikinase
VTFEAPGPGSWELDATHRGRRPVSYFARDGLMREGVAGFGEMIERYGLPLAGFRAELVQGCLYFRPIGLGENPDKAPKPPPPIVVMKVVARLHPGLRRRNRVAAAAWQEKRWRQEVDQWFGSARAETVARNLDLQRVDVAALDDDELVAHVDAALRNFKAGARLNTATHGGDLMPAGDFFAHTRRFGVADADAAALLRGSSPATIETMELLAPVARAIAAAERAPTSVDEVRALSPDAAAAVDAWFELHAWRLVTSDDIDKPTLAERPSLQLAALLAATDPADVTPPDASPVRAKVPAEDRALFDELLAEARYGMRQRDDNVGVRWNWSGGLLRRALLEVGRRLVAADRLKDPEHVVELVPDELAPLLLRGTGPSLSEIADRAAFRDLVEAAHAPDTLGDPEPPPPIDALPRPMARATAALLTVLEVESSSGAAPSDAITGAGIGTTTYRGIARVATTADDALDRLEPGDVLIAPFTGPSYNSILPILGALVVDAGGLMCHAAIVAREFSLPAVVGATGATARIADGARVEVDPVAGAVRVVD